MYFSKDSPKFNFTRLHAQIVEEDDAFTVRIRMLNDLKTDESAWGEEIAATFEVAAMMIATLASEFSISQNCISIKIVMSRFKDGTMH
jgi:hypothetical protein